MSDDRVYEGSRNLGKNEIIPVVDHAPVCGPFRKIQYANEVAETLVWDVGRTRTARSGLAESFVERHQGTRFNKWTPC